MKIWAKLTNRQLQEKMEVVAILHNNIWTQIAKNMHGACMDTRLAVEGYYIYI